LVGRGSRLGRGHYCCGDFPNLSLGLAGIHRLCPDIDCSPAIGTDGWRRSGGGLVVCNLVDSCGGWRSRIATPETMVPCRWVLVLGVGGYHRSIVHSVASKRLRRSRRDRMGLNCGRRITSRCTPTAAALRLSRVQRLTSGRRG
jgi:hypothetical protein